MNLASRFKAAVLIASAVAFVGCNSRQEAPGGSSAPTPQNGGEIKSISGQNATGGVGTSPQEKAAAEAAAARILARMEAGDFAAIYKEASSGFRQIGSESQFVAKFQQVRQKTGPLTKSQEVSFVTYPGNTHVLIFAMENERFRTERRLTLARAKSGKMELAGLNQHDEPKQPARAK